MDRNVSSKMIEACPMLHEELNGFHKRNRVNPNSMTKVYPWMIKHSKGKSKVDTLNINKEKIKTKTRRVFEQSTQLQLEMEFRSSPYLTSWKRQDLSEKLNLSERQVRVWFQNRRMRVKNEKRNKRRHREFDKTINITQSYLTTGRLHMGHWTSSQASYYSLLATSESADNFFASDNLPNGYYSSIDYQPILSNVFYDPSFLLQHPVTNETYAAAQYQYQDDTFSKL